jgi:hypothetical protein
MFQAINSYNATMEKKDKLIQEGRREEAEQILALPSTYITMTSIIGSLKKIGYSDEEGDKIILCGDGRNCWRKEIEKSYKGNREEQRSKLRFVDFDKEFENHNQQLERIKENLPMFVIKLDRIEADDIISEATRYFANNLCIVVSSDKDFTQLLTYDNVRWYSTHRVYKDHPYKILSLDRNREKELAYKELMKKVEIEKTDNLCSPVLNEEDYDKRLMCVSLLDLPQEIKDKIRPELEKINVTGKEFFYPEAFSPGIAKRLPSIFGTENIITYEACRLKMERKLKKEKNTTIKPKKSKKTKEVSEPIDRDEVRDDTQSDLYGDR